VDQTNSAGSLPSTAQAMIMVSSTWTQMITELNMISSTLLSFTSSVCFTMVVVFLFTGNFLLALYTTITIVLNVSTLFGFLLYVMKWEFGAIEAVGVIFFVGLSVDYCLHINHSYNMALAPTRYQKVKETLQQLGTAVFGGAFTTIGCAVFLWPCYIYLFVQLGVMIFANMLLALLYSFLFLCPLLMVAGPTGYWCSFYACCQRHSRRARKLKRSGGGVELDALAVAHPQGEAFTPQDSDTGAGTGLALAVEPMPLESIAEDVEASRTVALNSSLGTIREAEAERERTLTDIDVFTILECADEGTRMDTTHVMPHGLSKDHLDPMEAVDYDSM